MIAKILKTGLFPSSYADLLLQNDKFACLGDANGQLKYDDATMVFLMFQKVDPNTVVGMGTVC